MAAGAAASAAAALLLLLLLAPFAPRAAAQGSDVTVRSDTEFYNSFTSQGVGRIGVAYSPAGLQSYAQQLYDNAAANGPFPVNRSLTVYGAWGGGKPRFDFAYLGAVIKVASGLTLTLQGLDLHRMQALRAPVGLLATSPGATVVIQDCVNNQQVCWPHVAAAVYFLQVFNRPFPGIQQATICAPLTEAFCNQYTFTDVGFYVNPSAVFGSGGYAMHYLNTLIKCEAFPSPLPVCASLTTDIIPPGNPFNCLSTVFDPANQAVVCPSCQCGTPSGCRTACNALGIPQNPGC